MISIDCLTLSVIDGQTDKRTPWRTLCRASVCVARQKRPKYKRLWRVGLRTAKQ